MSTFLSVKRLNTDRGIFMYGRSSSIFIDDDVALMAISTLPLKAVQVRMVEGIMVGKCVWFCGVRRAYHVTDSELVSQLHAHGCVGPYKYPSAQRTTCAA
jgi:hypothetical protein